MRPLVPLCLAAMVLPACTASYSADVHNQTPQPLFAQILWRTDDGRNPTQAELRIAPGDRATLGPAQIPVGRALLTLVTLPNPKGPYTSDLRPGLTAFSVTQHDQPAGRTAGPLEVREIGTVP